jgi:hypothetical protein
MKTRDDIITSMCYTYRHDYGLNKDVDDAIGSGMTESQRKFLWDTMAQLFDNCVSPHMEFKDE